MGSFFDDWPGDSIRSEMVGSGVDGLKVLGAWLLSFLAWLTGLPCCRGILDKVLASQFSKKSSSI